MTNTINCFLRFCPFIDINLSWVSNKNAVSSDILQLEAEESFHLTHMTHYSFSFLVVVTSENIELSSVNDSDLTRNNDFSTTNAA